MDDLSVKSTDAPSAEGGARSRRMSPMRIAGYSLHNLWLLATFYNTFLFVSAVDSREALYVNQMLSLAVLTIALGALPLLVKNLDKWVLSRYFVLTSGVAMAVFTSLLLFADSDTPLGLALIIVSAVGTGISSCVLFLGWTRLYADVGPRPAMLEIGISWIAASVGAVVLSLMPAPLSAAVVVASALASALLLRRATFNRSVRPQPARPHRLQKRTRHMFARGLVACMGIGLVMGFSDVLCGYRFVTPPLNYEIYLAVSCILSVAVISAAILISKHDFVTHAHRLVMFLMIAGCLLTPFVSEAFTFSNIVIFGAYTSFTVVLSAVCIDTSNYFDQPATRTFGLAFFALYGGEIVGNGLAMPITEAMEADITGLSITMLVLTIAVVFADLFLFTEKDLTETSLGEMIDDDSDDEDANGGTAGMPTAGSVYSQEQRIACITALFVQRFGLTPREADVLPLIIKGRTIARIQEELHISQGTVSTHTRHIYQKAGVHNRQALLDMIETIADDEPAAVQPPQ